MVSKPIDVWDANTFDAELTGALGEGSSLIRNYMTTDHKIFLAHDSGLQPRTSPMRPLNPFAADFSGLQDMAAEMMQSRTIRAWHYTRLADAEVQTLQHGGIHLSTPATLRARLDALVASGDLTAGNADALYAASPFQTGQRESRSNKFWMVSHPVAIDDNGVKLLLAYWGGEVASMYVRDSELLKVLAAVGKPRVLEIAVPLSLTRCAYAAGKAVVATFARTLGCTPGKQMFDVCMTSPLGPESIQAVHSEGDALLEGMGRVYPDGYVDVSIDYWKELTGEE